MSEANSLVSAACICVALVLAVNAFMHFQRARTLEPLVTVNHDGIRDLASLPAIGFIRWRDVSHLITSHGSGGPIWPSTPPENWMKRTELPPWKRVVEWCKSHPPDFPIMIPLSAMEEVPTTPGPDAPECEMRRLQLEQNLAEHSIREIMEVAPINHPRKTFTGLAAELRHRCSRMMLKKQPPTLSFTLRRLFSFILACGVYFAALRSNSEAFGGSEVRSGSTAMIIAAWVVLALIYASWPLKSALLVHCFGPLAIAMLLLLSLSLFVSDSYLPEGGIAERVLSGMRLGCSISTMVGFPATVLIILAIGMRGRPQTLPIRRAMTVRLVK